MLKGYKGFVEFPIILPTFAPFCQVVFLKMSFFYTALGMDQGHTENIAS
jgi:hypothetical protein